MNCKETLARKASSYHTFQPRLNRVHLPGGAGASEAGQQQQGGVICTIPFAASPFHHFTLPYAAIFPDMHTGLQKKERQAHAIVFFTCYASQLQART